MFLIRHILSAVIIFRSMRTEMCRGAAVPLSSRVTFIIRNIHIRNLHRRCPARYYIRHLSSLGILYGNCLNTSYLSPVLTSSADTLHRLYYYATLHKTRSRGCDPRSRWHVILASSTKDIANIATRCDRYRSLRVSFKMDILRIFFPKTMTLFFTARTRVTPSLPCTPSCTRIIVCPCSLILSRRSRLASTPARVLMRKTSRWTNQWRSIPLVSMVLEKRGRILISERNKLYSDI